VFGALSSSRLTSLLALSLLFLFVWAVAPMMFGPLVHPLDRLLLASPWFGAHMRRNNSVRLAGWLGFAASDANGRRAALVAARSWSNDLFARACADVLARSDRGQAFAASIVEARAFDCELQATVALSDPIDVGHALRARARASEYRRVDSGGITVALVHLVMGVPVAALVAAMYLPLFKIAAAIS